MVDVQCIHHLGLAVRDVEESTNFYCQCGYSPADRLQLSGPGPATGNGLRRADLDVVFAFSPALTLELVEFDPVGRELHEMEPSFGTVPVWEDAPAPHDPDGRPVVVSSPDRITLQLSTADVVLTSRLFQLLGFTGSDEGTLVGHGVRVDLLSVPRPPFTPAANMPGRVHVCFLVADMAVACGELADAGFGMISSPQISENLQWAFVCHEEGPGVELLSMEVQ